MLANKFKDIDIILASQSPRRQELLKGLDIDFRIATRPVNEVYNASLKTHEITDYLAILKASAFKKDLIENQLLITSDTIVWFQNAAMEKPKDAAHAKRMLSSLGGAIHEVHTSVCFTTAHRQEVIHDVTKVHLSQLTDKEIDYYLKQYQPFDKAGAYGIQDWLGYTTVTKIEGCYYNVMGLPLPKVYKFLKEF